MDVRGVQWWSGGGSSGVISCRPGVRRWSTRLVVAERVANRGSEEEMNNDEGITGDFRGEFWDFLEQYFFPDLQELQILGLLISGI